MDLVDPRSLSSGHPGGAGRLPRATVTPDGTGWAPPGRLPHPTAVRYARDGIGLILLLVALPWLLYHLLTNPSRVLAARGPSGGV